MQRRLSPPAGEGWGRGEEDSRAFIQVTTVTGRLFFLSGSQRLVLICESKQRSQDLPLRARQMRMLPRRLSHSLQNTCPSSLKGHPLLSAPGLPTLPQQATRAVDAFTPPALTSLQASQRPLTTLPEAEESMPTRERKSSPFLLPPESGCASPTTWNILPLTISYSGFRSQIIS